MAKRDPISPQALANFRARRKAWKKTAGGKANARKNRARHQKLYYLRYPERRRANVLLQQAVRCGRVVRPKACPKCGITGVIIGGHHRDYSKPLEVDWLCNQCHVEEHGRSGANYTIIAIRKSKHQPVVGDAITLWKPRAES